MQINNYFVCSTLFDNLYSLPLPFLVLPRLNTYWLIKFLKFSCLKKTCTKDNEKNNDYNLAENIL